MAAHSAWRDKVTGDINLAPLDAKSYTTVWKPDIKVERQARHTVEERPGPPWLLCLALLGGAGILLFYSLRENLLIGTIAAPILFLTGMHGLWRGGFRKLFMLPVVLVALWVLVEAPAKLGPTLYQYIPQRDVSLAQILIAASSLPILIVGLMVVQSIRRRLIMRRASVHRFDRFIGALVGLVEGGLVVLTICWSTLALAPQVRKSLEGSNVPQDSLAKNVADGLLKIADEAQTGKFGEIVARTNLLAKFPELQDLLERISVGKIPMGGNSQSFMDNFSKLIQNEKPAIKEYEQNTQTRDQQQEQLRKQNPPPPGN